MASRNYLVGSELGETEEFVATGKALGIALLLKAAELSRQNSDNAARSCLVDYLPCCAEK